VVPAPGLGVDRLADGAEELEAREVVAFHGLVAVGHEHAHGGGRGVEVGDAVLLDDLPPAVEVRVVGRAFVHHLRDAGHEGRVDDVGVSGDPADVGGTPVDGVVGCAEDPAEGGVAVDEVAAGVVDDALGFAGRAGGEEHVEGVGRLDGLGVDRDVGFGKRIVEPDVTAGGHVDISAGAANDDLVGGGGRFGHRFIGDALEGHDLATAVAAVGGDEQFGVEFVHAVGEGVGAEAGEDDGVEGADAGAGEHEDDEFGDHGQVEGDGVALLDTEITEYGGAAIDLAVEAGVGQRAGVAGLAFPVDRDLVLAMGGEVAVEALIGGVEPPADEPACERGLPVENLVPALEPVEAAGLLGPEGFGVFHGAAVRLVVAGGRRLGVVGHLLFAPVSG
jgi:hypothetical protein